MAVYSVEITFKTDAKEKYYNITDIIQEKVAEAALIQGITIGICSLFLKHTTASLLIQEFEPFLMEDCKNYFNQNVAEYENEYAEHTHFNNENLKDKSNGKMFSFGHDCLPCSGCDRKNTSAHIKTILQGIEITLHIKNGKVDLGKWQKIILWEHDGPKDRKISVMIIGENDSDYDIDDRKNNIDLI